MDKEKLKNELEHRSSVLRDRPLMKREKNTVGNALEALRRGEEDDEYLLDYLNFYRVQRLKYLGLCPYIEELFLCGDCDHSKTCAEGEMPQEVADILVDWNRRRQMHLEMLRKFLKDR